MQPRPLAAPSWRWLLFSLPLLLFLAWTAWFFAAEVDAAVWFARFRETNPEWTAFFRILSDWGNFVFYAAYVWILATGLLRGDRSRIRLAVAYVVVQLLISLLLVRVLKISLGRPRPDALGPYSPMTLSPSHHSLPSGHTTEANASALPLGLRAWSAWPSLLLGLYVGLIGASRVILGWHHPSDVFFGWLLGSVAGFIIHLFSHPDRT